MDDIKKHTIMKEAEKIFLYADVIAKYLENKDDFRHILHKSLDDLINNPTIGVDKKSIMAENRKILGLWELPRRN